MPNRKVNNKNKGLNNAARARMAARRNAVNRAKRANNSLLGMFRAFALRAR